MGWLVRVILEHECGVTEANGWEVSPAQEEPYSPNPEGHLSQPRRL